MTDEDNITHVDNPSGTPGRGGVEAEESVESDPAETSEIVTDEPPTE